MAVLLAYYLVFYLNLHACTAKLVMVSDKKSLAGQLPFRSKVKLLLHIFNSTLMINSHKNQVLIDKEKLCRMQKRQSFSRTNKIKTLKVCKRFNFQFLSTSFPIS